MMINYLVGGIPTYPSETTKRRIVSWDDEIPNDNGQIMVIKNDISQLNVGYFPMINIQKDGTHHRNLEISLSNIWQCVKTNSTPAVHIQIIKIAGIYGCSSH